jgi:hypothetical protein
MDGRSYTPWVAHHLGQSAQSRLLVVRFTGFCRRIRFVGVHHCRDSSFDISIVMLFIGWVLGSYLTVFIVNRLIF